MTEEGGSLLYSFSPLKLRQQIVLPEVAMKRLAQLLEQQLLNSEAHSPQFDANMTQYTYLHLTSLQVEYLSPQRVVEDKVGSRREEIGITLIFKKKANPKISAVSYSLRLIGTTPIFTPQHNYLCVYSQMGLPLCLLPNGTTFIFRHQDCLYLQQKTQKFVECKKFPAQNTVSMFCLKKTVLLNTNANPVVPFVLLQEVLI